MKKETHRYKDGVLGFLAEFRWLFGALAGVLVANVTKPEANPAEIGFLGMLLWMHIFLGAISAIVVFVVLEALGKNPNIEPGDSQ
jgi:hypothetical protein